MLITPKKFSKKNKDGSNSDSARKDGSTRGGATTTLDRSFKDEDDDWHHISH